MQKKYSDNFLPVKAAGREGDRKADGYLFPEKRVYQVYAPSSGFKKDKLLSKIVGDFEGAKEKWKSEMLGWTFVHNEFEGLPAYAIEQISALRAPSVSGLLSPPLKNHPEGDGVTNETYFPGA